MIKTLLTNKKFADKAVRELENVFSVPQLIESFTLANFIVCTLTREKRIVENHIDFIWKMTSTRTGTHCIYAERFVNERVIAHWEGFIENNNKLNKL